MDKQSPGDPYEYQIRQSLLEWFQEKGRKFYWRVHYDLYTVLVVEILLKKTTAGVVDRFLPVFFAHCPTIGALNGSPLSELENLLAPLGLSKQRAIQLKGLSERVVELYGGKIPCNKEDLLKLPGVGDYVAGAVLSFACGLPEAIVDTNIARLILRLFNIKPSRCEPRRSPEVWRKAAELVGQDGEASRRINWALLDLASTICKPKKPSHGECPVKEWCDFAKGELIPEMPNKSILQ